MAIYLCHFDYTSIFASALIFITIHQNAITVLVEHPNLGQNHSKVFTMYIPGAVLSMQLLYTPTVGKYFDS